MTVPAGSATTVYVGCGAGFADERPDACIPVVETLARRDGPRYLIFETLGERTLALAQLERRREPAAGFTPGTAAFLRPILRRCREAGIRIVANFGAANSLGAGRLVLQIAAELGLPDFKVGIVEGDDLLEYVPEADIRSWPTSGRGRSSKVSRSPGSRSSRPTSTSARDRWPRRCAVARTS